ncbi:sulfatase [Bacteroidota bacterium]
MLATKVTKSIGFASILFSVLPFCSPRQKSINKSEKPNIVFFIADDLYPEMLNYLPEGKGKNLTPNSDRLAQEGTIMVNQYVVSPVSTPSRYNCLTGNYASRAQNEFFLEQTKKEEGQTVIHWNTEIIPNDKILPHYLHELGYKTGMVGKNHVIEAKDLYEFPDYWADAKDPEIDKKVKENYEKSWQAILNCGFDYAEGIYHNNPNWIGLGELAVQNLDWTTEAGLNFIDKYHNDPFFLYFATTIPHQPSQPELSWNANPLITANGYLDKAPDVLPPRHTLPERIKEAGLDGNNEELILWLDDAVGALLDKLEENDILDNTIIFFFNDHGQKAKGSLYQGGTLSPSFVWRKGGFKCGNICMANVLNIDFTPTILEFAGADFKHDVFDGKSFKSILEDEKDEIHKSLYFELGYARAIIKGKYKYYAIRYPDYAINMTSGERAERLEAYNGTRRFRNMPIVNSDPAAPFSHFSIVPGGEQAEHESYGKKPAYFDPDQLYDLETDPNEMNNIANDPAFYEILEELKAELKKYIDDLPGKFII